MTSDTEENKRRLKKAIDVFVNTFNGSYQKLDPTDVGYKIFDKNKNLIAYAEVCVKVQPIKYAYPLQINAKKLLKLIDKRMSSVMIWSCEDGILYSRPNQLLGTIKLEGEEMMVYYDKQKSFKYVRFI
jgi:hypothetical protein